MKNETSFTLMLTALRSIKLLDAFNNSELNF